MKSSQTEDPLDIEDVRCVSGIVPDDPLTIPEVRDYRQIIVRIPLIVR